MCNNELNRRLESAMGSGFQSCYDLAKVLKAEGVSQQDILELYERHVDMMEPDSPECNMLLDVMDCLVGWCSPECRIFPSAPQEQ